MTQTNVIAAHKAWRTIRENKKIFDGFEKPSDDYKFGIHVECMPSCNGLCSKEQILYYKSKNSMHKDIKKFQNDDQIYSITVFEVMYIKSKDF